MKTITKTKQRLILLGINSLTVILAFIGVCLFLASGCASAYRATSKPFIGYSQFAPVITLNPNSTTNLAQECRLRHGSSSTTRSDMQADARIHAPVIICAEQLYLSFYGGSAASNSVLSEITVPLTGAP